MAVGFETDGEILVIGLEVELGVESGVDDGGGIVCCFEEGIEDVTGVDVNVEVVGTDVIVEPRLRGGLRFEVEVGVVAEGLEARELKEGRDVDETP